MQVFQLVVIRCLRVKEHNQIIVVSGDFIEVLKTDVLRIVTVDELVYSEEVSPTLIIPCVHLNSEAEIPRLVIYHTLHTNHALDIVLLAFRLKLQCSGK